MTISAIPATFGSTPRAAFDAGGLQLSSVVFPPRFRLRPHVHERACLLVVLEGSAGASLGGDAHAQFATVQTIPAETLHEDDFAPGPTPTLIVEAEPEAAESLGAYGIRLDEVRYLRDAGICALGVRIARELEAPNGPSALTVEGLALELFALLAQHTNGSAPSHSPPAWLARARECVHERFAAGFSVADVAREVRVHPAHLAREFRRHYELPIGEYARRLRLDSAAARLATTEDSLAAVAFDSGFAHQSHFTRAFKRHTGLTPARYRASTRT